MARRAGLQSRWLPRRHMKLLRKLDRAFHLLSGGQLELEAA
jgi:hypothetical protein